MIDRIVVGITTTALNALITNLIHFSKARERIYQHKILFSDTLYRIYHKHFEETGDEFFFEQWMREMNNNDMLEYTEALSDNIYEELQLQIKRYPQNIIVIYDDDLSKGEDIVLIDLKEIDSQSCENQLAKYCIPMNSIIRKGSNSIEFAKWFKDILSGEPKVTIIDRYILKPENNNILRDFYFPAIPANASIHVYYGADQEFQSIISGLKSRFGNRVHMHKSEPKDFHDRYIVCDSFSITIGVGFDVFDQTTGLARQESSYSMSNGERPTLPGPPRNPNRRYIH